MKLAALAVAIVLVLALAPGIALGHRGGGHGGGHAAHSGSGAGHGGGHGHAPGSSHQVAFHHRKAGAGGFGGPAAGSVCEPTSAWYSPEDCRQQRGQ